MNVVSPIDKILSLINRTDSSVGRILHGNNVGTDVQSCQNRDESHSVVVRVVCSSLPQSPSSPAAMKRPYGFLLWGLSTQTGSIEAYGVSPRRSGLPKTSIKGPLLSKGPQTRSDDSSDLGSFYLLTSPFSTAMNWQTYPSKPQGKNDATRRRSDVTKHNKPKRTSSSKSLRLSAPFVNHKATSSFITKGLDQRRSNNELPKQLRSFGSLLDDRKREFHSKFQELIHLMVTAMPKSSDSIDVAPYSLFVVMLATHIVASLVIPKDNGELMSAAHWAATNAFLYTTLARSWRRR